jgi:hypothetical protein
MFIPTQIIICGWRQCRLFGRITAVVDGTIYWSIMIPHHTVKIVTLLFTYASQFRTNSYLQWLPTTAKPGQHWANLVPPYGDYQSQPDVMQPGFKPGTVVTPLALKCSALDCCATREPFCTSSNYTCVPQTSPQVGYPQASYFMYSRSSTADSTNEGPMIRWPLESAVLLLGYIKDMDWLVSRGCLED